MLIRRALREDIFCARLSRAVFFSGREKGNKFFDFGKHFKERGSGTREAGLSNFSLQERAED